MPLPQLIQFAVSGPLPSAERWLKVAERFRGRVLRLCAARLMGNDNATYSDLQPEFREELALLSGKGADGQPRQSHDHARFILWPEPVNGQYRFVVLRAAPFTWAEVEAILHAAQLPLSWGDGASPTVCFTLLPQEEPPPTGASDTTVATVWHSLSCFVPPPQRFQCRPNGHVRQGQTPPRVLAKLLVKNGYPQPCSVESLPPCDGERVLLHDPLVRSPEVRRSWAVGYRFRIVFPEPAAGPICVGPSSHFGLGLFGPGTDVAWNQVPASGTVVCKPRRPLAAVKFCRPRSSDDTYS